MTTTRTAKQALAAFAAAAFAMLTMAGTAFGTTVHGADFHATGSALEQGEVDVLNVAGNQGDTVFVSVEQDGRDVAKYIPYTLGQDNAQGSGANWTGVVTLDIGGFGASALDGRYTVQAVATRAGDDILYEGALYGVYADLPDGAKVLVGTRTVGSSEASRTFVPADSLYLNGKTYKRAGEAAGTGALHFPYKEYDEAKTVDGVIRFVNDAGEVVATQKVPGLEYDKEQKAAVPQVVTGDDGVVYRTVCFTADVVMKNPGQTSCTVYCTPMSSADQAALNYYVAIVQLVDQEGHVIASDSVNVTGEYYYTAPSVVYKNEADEAGEKAVATYKLADSPTLHFSAASDGVFDGVRTYVVNYEREAIDAAEVAVTFNLVDGSKRVNEEGRLLQVQNETVSSDSKTAQPAEQLEVDGGAYRIVGTPGDYAYTYGDRTMPTIDVYYLPEGYAAPGPYDVTVNYVDFTSNQVVGSQTVQSSPDDLGTIDIEVPREFSEGDVDYVRLDGQGDIIQHSYYSGIATYTVYYRDVNDTLTSGTVINTIRVVYADGAEGAAGGAGAADADGDDANTATTAGQAAEALRLNDGRTYNVFDGDGNSTMTNEEGVDSNTERIEDNENPLAAGVAGENPQGSVVQGIQQDVLALAIVAAILAAGVVFWAKRRRDDKHNTKAEA